jgi:hypothetical protein
MIIGFCTPCMDRRWQMEKTLAQNLEVLRGTPHFLALCNFNSGDGLDEWIQERHREDQSRGTLVYFHTKVPTMFEASKAKNVAHRLALTRAPDVLFNLDADNFVSAETLRLLSETFSPGEDPFFHQWSQTWIDGSFGRIAMRAATWERLGGYDEALRKMGWVDMDLLVRARAIGLKYRPESGGIKPAIANNFMQKVAKLGVACDTPDTAQASFRELNKTNMALSFSRPIVHPMADQTKYPGLLNWATEATI